MLLIWISLLFEIIIMSLMKPLVVNFESVAIVAVMSNMLFLLIILFANKNKYKKIFLCAYLSRLLFMIWDLYARSFFILPHSGADSEGYFNSARIISEDISLINNNIYGGMYSKINGLLFYLIGPQRMFGQYINVLFGLTTILMIYKILQKLDIEDNIMKRILVIAALFPTSMIMSAIFLRESIITFLVVFSLYYFVKWFQVGRNINMFIAIIILGVASIFHSGVIGIAIGYIFIYLFYKRDTQTLEFSSTTIISFIAIIIVIALGITLYGDSIFYKFGSVDDISDIYSTANKRHGNSAYLTNLTINNPIQLAVFGPIKSLFFLTVPLPMNWRGPMDMFTFFSDSLLYLGVIMYLLTNKKKFGDKRILVIALMIMIIGAALIFGIGVSNAGTAIRHRQKLMPIFLILLAIMVDGKKKYFISKERQKEEMS